MKSRPVIDQARGMVMAVGPCTADQAWDVLVEVSQHTNIKLHAVAEQLVATSLGYRLREPVRRALGQAMQARRHHA
ncbi:ANTAR domain-containing protein [Streptomyces sp. MMCC 100]|uniref:ANTAR domain-containing protein n=1 Tax=Streptomyces sp. MMCC 100 TaxID=3163555 RepID=UPI0035974CD9